MSRNVPGFTLIELMIVVAIIGIISAIAIPSYMDFTARSQVAEAVTLTAALKGSVADWINNSDSLPTIDDLGATTSGKYVASVAVGGTTTVPTITATFKSSNISTSLKSKTLTLTSTDKGKTWSCTSTVDSLFLPSACK